MGLVNVGVTWDQAFNRVWNLTLPPRVGLGTLGSWGKDLAMPLSEFTAGVVSGKALV